jgi:hypothetical protein
MRPTVVVLGAFVILMTGYTVATMGQERPITFCVCGYNKTNDCDGETLWAYSDCYDENNNFCGTSVQRHGSCSSSPEGAESLPQILQDWLARHRNY